MIRLIPAGAGEIMRYCGGSCSESSDPVCLPQDSACWFDAASPRGR